MTEKVYKACAPTMLYPIPNIWFAKTEEDFTRATIPLHCCVYAEYASGYKCVNTHKTTKTHKLLISLHSEGHQWKIFTTLSTWFYRMPKKSTTSYKQNWNATFLAKFFLKTNTDVQTTAAPQWCDRPVISLFLIKPARIKQKLATCKLVQLV